MSGAAYEYDANGNLTFDGQSRYTYDQENRLVKATTASGALKAELWYDPMGRLYKIQNPSSTTHMLYDGDGLIAEFNGTSPTALNRYVHGISVDDPVVWFQGSSVTASTRKYLRANHQGSIVAVADSAGNKLHLPRYDNWGKPQGTHPLRFGYTGQAWIAELGLWHYKARMHSPTLGRFLQTDPVGYEDQINLYAYVGNDPVNKIDPTGMNSCTCQTQRAKSWTEVTRDIARRGIAGMKLAADMIAEAVSSESVKGTRDLGDLEPIHDADHPQNDTEIGELSDEELEEAINNPKKGDPVTVRGNKVLDGNTRVNEAKGRGWADDTKIPVVELPELPDNVDDDPLGPYR